MRAEASSRFSTRHSSRERGTMVSAGGETAVERHSFTTRPSQTRGKLPLVPGRYREANARAQHSHSKRKGRFHRRLNESQHSIRDTGSSFALRALSATPTVGGGGELSGDGWSNRVDWGTKANFYSSSNSFADSMSPACISVGALRRGGVEGLTGSHGARLGWNSMHMGSNYRALARGWGA